MFCPGCGTEISSGVRFCTKCGTSLLQAETEQGPPAVSMKLVIAFLSAICLVTLCGLAAISETIGTVRNTPLPPNNMVETMQVMIVFGVLAIIGVDALLVWLLVRLSGQGVTGKRKQKTPPLPQQVQQAQLPAVPISIPSVTEQTTRGFDRVPRKEEER